MATNMMELCKKTRLKSVKYKYKTIFYASLTGKTSRVTRRKYNEYRFRWVTVNMIKLIARQLLLSLLMYIS